MSNLRVIVWFEEFFHREAYRLWLIWQWDPSASVGTAEVLGSGIRAQITRVEDTSCVLILFAIGNTLRRVFLFFSGSTVIAFLAFPFDRFRDLPIVLSDIASILPVQSVDHEKSATMNKAGTTSWLDCPTSHGSNALLGSCLSAAHDSGFDNIKLEVAKVCHRQVW